jgi:hypothetical protein
VPDFAANRSTFIMICVILTKVLTLIRFALSVTHSSLAVVQTFTGIINLVP